jgi:hypothetical protein
MKKLLAKSSAETEMFGPNATTYCVDIGVSAEVLQFVP